MSTQMESKICREIKLVYPESANMALLHVCEIHSESKCVQITLRCTGKEYRLSEKQGCRWSHSCGLMMHCILPHASPSRLQDECATAAASPCHSLARFSEVSLPSSHLFSLSGLVVVVLAGPLPLVLGAWVRARIQAIRQIPKLELLQMRVFRGCWLGRRWQRGNK